MGRKGRVTQTGTEREGCLRHGQKGKSKSDRDRNGRANLRHGQKGKDASDMGRKGRVTQTGTEREE